MPEKIRWGIMGTGNIAAKFAQGLPASRTGVLQGVASRRDETAKAFAGRFGDIRAWGSYDRLLADPDVDVVYITTPHPWHAEWAIKAARAGKHILCEKPMAMNAGQVRQMIDAARRAGVFLMEAFMYRCHAQTARLAELVRSGRIGQVKLIRATFGHHASKSPDDRFLSRQLGGGGILDVGCYTVSMARLIAGAGCGKAGPAEPLQISGCGHVGQTGVDEWAVANLKFPGDIVAQLAVSVNVQMDNLVQVFGTNGTIVVPWPWKPAGEGGKAAMIVQQTVHASGIPHPTEEVVVEESRPIYAVEADTVAENLAAGQAPAMTWADSLANAEALDAWLAAVGVKYE
ncbi:MAG: Gfo/Idh/MocA family oxidoreductase [Planctomycetes bacterium]|nr:Gfo/Idh/MocA family oxidoreductase [Planctomycetota bacterium]